MSEQEKADKITAAIKLLNEAPFCNVTFLARQINVGRATIYRWLEENQDLKAALQNNREVTLDFAELTVQAAIKEKDVKTAIWYIEQHGEGRGYGKKNVTINKLSFKEAKFKVEEDE